MTEKSGLDTPGRQLERPDTRVLSLLDNTGLTVALHQVSVGLPKGAEYGRAYLSSSPVSDNRERATEVSE